MVHVTEWRAWRTHWGHTMEYQAKIDKLSFSKYSEYNMFKQHQQQSWLSYRLTGLAIIRADRAGSDMG
jgi:hypothetical protein